MLIEITEAAVKNLSTSQSRKALENLSTSYREGHHILCVSPKVFGVIEKSGHFDAKTLAGFKRAAAGYSSISGLRRTLNFYISVTDIYSDTRSWSCSLEWFSRIESIMPSVFLCEYFDDTCIYMKFAEALLHRMGLKIKVNCDQQSGGGGSTPGQLKALKAKRRVVEVLIDTDRCHESAARGDTIKGVRNWLAKHKNWKQARIHLSELDAHEIENVIPTRLLELVSVAANQSSISAIKEARKILGTHARFLDLKKGSSRGELQTLCLKSNIEVPSPWNGGSQEDILIPPLPSPAEDVIGLMEHMSPAKILELFSEEEMKPLEQHLMDLISVSCSDNSFST